MTEKSPWFPLFPRDLLADTAHLSPDAFTAYVRLLCYAWVGIAGHAQATLPNDDEQLSALAAIGPDAWSRVRASVVGLFTDRGAVLESKRLMAELRRQKERKRHGKHAAKLRWGQPDTRASMNSAQVEHGVEDMPNGCLSSSSSEREEPRSVVEPSGSTARDVSRVMASCNEVTGRKLKLTPGRRRKIAARLKDGFSVDQLVDAMKAAHADPFYRGENDRDRRYDDPETIFKSVEVVEKHLEHGGMKRTVAVDDQKARARNAAIACWSLIRGTLRQGWAPSEVTGSSSFTDTVGKEAYLRVRKAVEEKISAEGDVNDVWPAFARAYWDLWRERNDDGNENGQAVAV